MKEKLPINSNRTPEKYGCLAILGIVLLTLIIVFAALCAEGWLVMLLWNAVIVSVFGAPVLSYWVSVGIVLLCHILFQSIQTITKD